MTVRLDADEATYQHAIAAGSLIPLFDETPIREYRYWRIVDNRFPHTRLARVNHMLVLKHESSLEGITGREWREFFTILLEIRHEYDTVSYNLPYLSSIKNVPHCHLYVLREEYK